VEAEERAAIQSAGSLFSRFNPGAHRPTKHATAHHATRMLQSKQSKQSKQRARPEHQHAIPTPYPRPAPCNEAAQEQRKKEQRCGFHRFSSKNTPKRS